MKREARLQGVMSQLTSLDRLPVFVAVAEALSFTAAAQRLGISPSAASQAVRTLEKRLGTLLLHRSTRSIRLTEAGSEYLARVGPALVELQAAARDVAGRHLAPSGPLRLTVPRAAFNGRVAPMLAAFCRIYPEIEVEVNVEGRLIDIVQHRFDAGIRYGDMLERDTVAVKLSEPSEAVLVAAPDYLARHGIPTELANLVAGRAVVGRSALDGRVIAWRLQSDGEPVLVTPRTRVIVHDLVSEIDLAVRGLGVACLPVASIADHLRSGALRRVLPDWRQPLASLYLYYVSQRHKSAALAAFVAFLQAGVPS